MRIDPKATIAKGVVIGKNVTIGPLVSIASPEVVLEDGVVIEPYVYIEGAVTVGEGSIVRSMASIGTKAQSLRYGGEKTSIHIGRKCDIGEYVTINASCEEGGFVKIGDGCQLMSHSHVGHNCVLGDYVTLERNVHLGGYVTVGDRATIGEMSPIHQFFRIGSFATVGKMSRVTHDVPPYTHGGGYHYVFNGVCAKRLAELGVSDEVSFELQKAVRMIYEGDLCLEGSLKWIESHLCLYPEILTLIDFCRHSKRGLIGLN